MDFGFTNDRARLAAAVAFRNAAAADGWHLQPSSPSEESVTRAAQLTRDGFTILILSRPEAPPASWRYQVSVDIWGPDGLTIPTPPRYGMGLLRAGLRTCPHCGATDVETVRFNFAGRCCRVCLPAMRRRAERPGWNL